MTSNLRLKTRIVTVLNRHSSKGDVKGYITDDTVDGLVALGADLEARHINQRETILKHGETEAELLEKIADLKTRNKRQNDALGAAAKREAENLRGGMQREKELMRRITDLERTIATQANAVMDLAEREALLLKRNIETEKTLDQIRDIL